MALIRMQEKVPQIYVDRSRDFQILCRSYDSALNQVKFDIDSMPFILSSSKCRDSVLPLLQTKLGFFTNKHISGDSLRIILDAFPTMVRHKGSLVGIQMAVNAWLKVIHLETQVVIEIFNLYGGSNNRDNNRTIGGYIGTTEIPAYTVAIGVGGNPRDYSILKELLKYVMPTGYGLYFYFFKSFKTNEQLPLTHPVEEKAVLVKVSDDVNSVVRNAADDNVVHDDLSIIQAEQKTVGKIITTAFTTEAIGSEDAILETAPVGTEVARDELRTQIINGPDYVLDIEAAGESATFELSGVDEVDFASLTIEWGTDDVE